MTRAKVTMQLAASVQPIEIARAARHWFEADQRRLEAGRKLRDAQTAERAVPSFTFASSAVSALRHEAEAVLLEAKKDERRAKRALFALCRRTQDDAETVQARAPRGLAAQLPYIDLEEKQR